MRSRSPAKLRLPTKDSDFVGKTFGLLTVVARCTKEEKPNTPHVYFHCQCACGGTSQARAAHLRFGSTTSCGCKKRGRPLGSGAIYTHNGQSMTIKQWAEFLGIRPSTLNSRLASHWPIERILGEKPRKKAQ